MSDNIGFGEPTYSENKAKYAVNPKKGAQIWRIIPPFANAGGVWHKPHACHYGYSIQKGDKEIIKPFYCVEESQWVDDQRVVTKHCPECDAIAAIQKKVDRTKVALEAEGRANELSTVCGQELKWLSKHNREYKEYINVKDIDGRFFTAKVAKKSVLTPIIELCKKARARRVPIDPISHKQGLWFRITRSGEGMRGTTYSVEIVQEEVLTADGSTSYTIDKAAPLSADDCAAAKASCMDLNDVGIRRLSVEQIKSLVESRGNPEIVKAILFGADELSSNRRDDDFEMPSMPEESPAPAPAPVEAQSKPEAAPKAASPAGLPPEEIEAVLARAHKLTQHLTNPGKAAPAPAAAPKPTANQPVTISSPEDMLANWDN